MRRRKAFALLFSLLVLPPSVPVEAQVSPHGSAQTLDPAIRHQIAEEFARAMREHYIYPDRAEQVAARVTASLASGSYDSARTAGELAGRLSAEASSITHDKHLTVVSMQEPQLVGPSRKMPAAEAGVVRADMMADGVGYIEMVGFPPISFSKNVIDRIMASLSGSRALIIDMRRNGGGDPETVAYVVSFLVPPNQPINDIVSRVEKTTKTTRKSYQSVQTPVTFFDVPVYVLTSTATFSGGEEFAYDVQALKRGTLIGDTTGGGANPVGPVDIGHGLVAMIPFGRAENPITKSNWEGIGVKPDVSVAADTALAVALEKLGLEPSVDIAAVSAKRLFSPRTTQMPGSDTAVRRLLDAITRGTTTQDLLTPQFASTIEPQISERRAELAKLITLLSVDFWRPNPFGGDEYKLTFANGRRKTVIFMDGDGKIAGMLPLASLGPDE